MENIKDLISKKALSRDFRNSHEYQAYGNRLAEELGDMKHRALYIKLAKKEPRELLERARDYIKSSEKAVTKGKLFMWKLTQLKQERLQTPSN